ncbi:MAG: carboxypeptidase-like regulatory domain-containing protein [Terracidiphilus sp.]
MKSIGFVFHTLAASLLFAGALAQAQQITGTVTDKTTGKPAAGDTVVLVNPQAAMGEVARATTDAHGHYLLNAPGAGSYLVRVTHQGAPYFIAAPQGNAPGDIPVYDVAAKVTGVYCEADVMEMESVNGQLHVVERFFVHNTSMPPKTQWSTHSFEVVLPPDALLEDAAAQRPSGLPTALKMDPDGPKGHYAFNFPIEPDNGQKSTLFQFSYAVPYSSHTFTFHIQETLPTESVGVLLPKSMKLVSGPGPVFQSVPEDPSVQTFVAKNAVPGKILAFTVTGTGALPDESQSSGQGDQSQGAASNQPGGGLGTPIGTPDPLSRYKWFILGGLALLLAGSAGVLLRKPAAAAVTGPAYAASPAVPATSIPMAGAAAQTGATGQNPALMNALKDELFAIESERLAGTLGAEEYEELKAALDKVLQRALKRKA